MRCSLLLALLLAGCATTPPPVAMLTPPLTGLVFGAIEPEAVRNLVIVVHDDLADEAQPTHVAFARRAAAAVPAGAAVAVMRPGFGGTTGTRERGNGDGYTAEAVRLLGETVRAHRQRFPGARTILVGDGGGAAIVANLAGSQPALVDAMLLVGCPCTLPEWRAMMAKRNPRGGFGEDVDSLDPLQTVGGIAPNLRTAIVVGDDDPITPPRFSRTYAEALALRGIATDFRRLPGRGHDVLSDPETLQALAQLATPVAQATANR